MEGGSSPDRRRRALKALLRLDKAGALWYADEDGSPVVLDKNARREMRRQRDNPGTPPAPGYPEFEARLSRGEMSGTPNTSSGADSTEDTDAAGDSGNDSEQRRQEAKERRNAARAELNEKYGNRQRVPGVMGYAWRDPDTGDAYAVRANGDIAKISAGESHNFGTRDNPQWKKWTGDADWANASPRDIQATQSTRGRRIDEGLDIRALDSKFQAAFRNLEKLAGREIKKKDRIALATRGVQMTNEEFQEFRRLVVRQESGRSRNNETAPSAQQSSPTQGGDRVETTRERRPEREPEREPGRDVGRGGELSLPDLAPSRATYRTSESRESLFTPSARPPQNEGYNGPMDFSLEKAFRAKSKRERFEKITDRKLRGDEATPDEPPSVAEFVQNPQMKDIFADLVKDIDDSGDKERSMGALGRLGDDKALTDEDRALFEKARYEYGLRMEEVNQISEILEKNGDFASILESSDSIRQLVGTLPKGRAVEIMKETLPMLAMKNRHVLDEFNQALDRVAIARQSKEYKDSYAKAEKLCKENGFTEEDIAALDMNDPDNRRYFENKVSERLNGFTKVLDNLTFGRVGSATVWKIDNAIKQMKDSKGMQEVDSSFKTVGDMLAMTLSSNPRIMDGITREIRTGQQVRIISDEGRFRNSREMYRELNQTFKEDKITGEWWGHYKRALERGHRPWGIEGDGVKWEDREPDEQEAAKNNYIKGLKKSQGFGEVSGLLASVLAALFARRLDGIDKSKLT